MAEFNLGQVAFFDKGLFSLSETYTKWDFVTTTDSTYLCMSDTPIIGKEVTNTTYWKCIADGKSATLAATLAVEKAGYAQEQGELAQTARENIEGDLALKIDKTSIISELGDSEELVMSQKGVTDELGTKANHGYESNPKTLKEVDESVNDVRDGLGSLGLEQVLGYNFIEHLYGISREDTEVWGNGYLTDDGSVGTAGGWRYTRDYIRVYKGTYDVNIYVSGNACLLIYNDKKEVVKAEKNIGGAGTTAQGRNITIEENGFIRFSYPRFIDEGGTSIPLEGRHFTNTSVVILSDNSVFLKTSEAGKLVNDTVNTNLSYYGLTPILPGNNFISELTGSSVLDTSLWGNGLLTSTGSIVGEANWYHSKKYYRLPRGSYRMFFYARGNAKILVYDENKENIVRVLENTAASDGKQYNETFDQDVYLRISHREGGIYDNSTNDIYVDNTVNVYDKVTASINIDNTVTVGSKEAVASGAIPAFMRDIYKKMYPPRTKRPIVTFICDDGHIGDKDWYIPLLDEYNVKSTLAISKHWVVGADNGDVSRLNSEDVINYHKDGHDIANQTINHLRLNEMTLEEADNEIGGSYLFLKDLINDDIPMFVSPFGIRNANIDEIVARYHKANFISDSGVSSDPPIDSYTINRVSFDTLDNNVLLWESRLLPALDSCLENSEWLVFAIHSGYGTYSSENPVYMERRDELRLIIEWCNTNDVQIMTAKNAYNYWRNPVEIGVKRKDVNYYRLGMDGTEEGQGVLM